MTPIAGPDPLLSQLHELRRFRQALDAAGEFVILIDHEAMKIVDASESACRASNLSRVQLVQAAPHEVFNMSADELTRALDDVVAASPGSRRVQHPWKQPDGSHRIVEFIRRAVKLDGRWIIVSTGRDITARHRAEAALQASEARHRTILDSMEEVFYEVDLKGCLVQFNRTMREAIGRPAEELPGMHYSEYIPAEMLPKVFEAFNEVYRTGKSGKQSDWAMRNVNGQVILFEGSIHLVKDEETGDPIGFRGLLRDVTQRRKVEAALLDSERRFRDLTQLSSDWYWEQDAAHRFTLVSERLAIDTGLMPVDCLGRTLAEIGMTAASPADHKVLQSSLAAGLPFRDVVMRHGEAPRYISLSGQPVTDEQGAWTGHRGTGTDITERRLADERIRHVAAHDSLTALPNRAAFTQVLTHSVNGSGRASDAFALMFIDLDGFKQINDALGHGAGDEVLRVTADRMLRRVRASDVVARLGGDEFTVLLRQVQSPVQAGELAQVLVDEVASPIELTGGQRCQVSASVGICLYPAHGTEASALLRRADAAMYRAKQRGKNRWELYDESAVD